MSYCSKRKFYNFFVYFFANLATESLSPNPKAIAIPILTDPTSIKIMLLINDGFIPTNGNANEIAIIIVKKNITLPMNSEYSALVAITCPCTYLAKM